MRSRSPIAVLAALAGLLLLGWLLCSPHRELMVAESVFPADANGDLIRDDVGAMIRHRFGGNAAAFAASAQLARAWQRAVRQGDAARLPAEAAAVRQALACVFGERTLGKAGVDAQTMFAFVGAVHERMFDTPARQALWRRYEQASSRLPHGETPLNPCTFDLSALAG